MPLRSVEFRVNCLVEQCLALRDWGSSLEARFSEAEVGALLSTARMTFLSQPTLLELEAPLAVCGDIHGQFYDLLRLLDYGGMPCERNYLFLGDYVDRGRQSIETVVLLFCYKVMFPETFFMLRGNHEASQVNRVYGFYDECKRRYNVKLWRMFCDVFNCMPICAVIDDRIMCMHGGISPSLRSLEQVRRVVRPTDVPETGIICDLLWADPERNLEGWAPSDRGISYAFGADALFSFLEEHQLELVARGHQVVEDGYEFFGGRRLVTIFSAPNYTGEFDNAAAMMIVDQLLCCSFKVLKPATRKSKG